MAALTADVNCSIIGDGSGIASFVAAAADTYFRGSVVYIDTTGKCQVTAAAGDRILGISPKNQVVAADAEVAVFVFGLCWLPVGTNVAAADEGELAVNDGPTNSDNPGDLVAAGDITLAANDIALGTILRVTASQMLIRIGDFTGRIGAGTQVAWY